MPFFMIFCCRLHLVSTQQDIDERILNSGKVGFDMSSVGKDCAAQNLAEILIELGFYLCNGKDSINVQTSSHSSPFSPTECISTF